MTRSTDGVERVIVIYNYWTDPLIQDKLLA